MQQLSAFNLEIETVKKKHRFSVESAYQASKVFSQGGPYLDLLEETPWASKKDTRLKSSGRLLNFTFFGEDWELEPKTMFYDWLYINALAKNPSLLAQLKGCDAFTDIEFNPQKSINCQAHAAALYVSLDLRGMLREALNSSQSYRRMMGESMLARHDKR